VEHVFPRVQFFALLSNGSTHVAGRGQGVLGPEESVFFNQMNFIEGGPIGIRKDGLVLGQGLAKALNVKIGDSLTVLGQTVHGTLNGIDTTVTGIFNVGFKEADDMLFQIQLDQAQILLESDKIESMVLGLKQESDWPGFSQDFTNKFPLLEALSVYQIDFVWAENGRLFLTALMNLFRAIFLGVILLAIYNSASNTILERKRELGMLRANGESKASVIGLLVIEGATIAGLGVLLGVLLAFLVNFLIPGGITMPPTPGTNRALSIPLQFEFSAVLLAMATGAITAVLATFLSALQVLKLPIATALKS
jgi:putative ABC transport system permease protein